MKHFLLKLSLLFLTAIGFTEIVCAQKNKNNVGFINFKKTSVYISADSLNKTTSDTVFVSFSFSNSGTSPLKILDVITSCTCTSAFYTNKPVQPRQQGMITLKVSRAAITNRQKIFATVKSNATNDFVALRIIPSN